MDACIHDGFVWFEGLKEDIEREFFIIFLRIKKKISHREGKLVLRVILIRQLFQVHIFRSPVPRTKKIADILTNVDDAIEETDRIIEKTRELKKGLMQKLLTPRHWA